MANLLTKVKKTLNIHPRATLSRGYLRYRKTRNHIALKHFLASNNLVEGTVPTSFLSMREQINELKQHINRDYCFLDLPEYRNIGDHMIYNGSLNFLNTLPFQQRYEASIDTFHQSGISSDDIILLQGGGNLGDLWSKHQKFRENIVSSFKENKIIILPQTIYFKNDRNLEEASSIFSAHPDLTICVRDKRSYKTALAHFHRNTVLLLPDMASYQQLGMVKRNPETIRRVLFMKRKDKELKDSYSIPYIRNLDTLDWPPFEHHFFSYLHAKHKEHHFYLNEGIIFMAQYDLVISTRLHGCIMAALLGIPVIMVDNSYGKNYTYFQTWMQDMNHCYFAQNQGKVKKLLESHFPEVIK